MGNVVEYTSLKHAIIKSCTGAEFDSVKFFVNYDKLLRSVDDIGLTLVNSGTKSERIRHTDVAFLSEYFKGLKLSWLNEEKEHTTLIFVLSDSVDDECKELLARMNGSRIDDPILDKVEALSKIVANYPCYFATVISYKSNEPKRFGKPSYEIKCRANTVAIKREDYKYNQADM